MIVKEGIQYYEACKCYLDSYSERIFKASMITPEFRKKTFQTWDSAWLDDVVRNAHRCALNYMANFERIRHERSNSIALLGQSGAGKTHLLMAIANSLMDKNVSVLYFPFVEGFNELKSDLDHIEDRVTKMQKIDVLLIDDLFKGRTSPTPFQIEQMFGIVNYRYMNHLPVLISSERLMEDLLKIDEALGSRMYEMTRDYRVQLQGPKLNYRLKEDDHGRD